MLKTTSNTYWSKRFERLKADGMRLAEDYNAELADNYALAIEKLKSDVEAWYVRFGKENNVSLADARRILDHRELKAFRLTLKEYTKLAKKENLPADYQRMLENASIRVRLTKSQEIYIRMLDYVTRLSHQQEAGLASVLKQAYEDTVYKTAYETQSMQRNFRGFDRVPEDTINTVIRKPWARDGKDFSARIWENRDALINNLQTELTQSLMAQEGTAPLTARLAKRMNVSYSNAKRLVETETAYIQEKASLDAYTRLDVEQYRILATLDNRTSETCRHLDGKVFDKKDAKPGITMPPFHCYCRTTTIPYINGITDEGTTRTARDPENGKTAFVDGDLTYPKWYNNYVKQHAEPTGKGTYNYTDLGQIIPTKTISQGVHYRTKRRMNPNDVIERFTGKRHQRTLDIYDSNGFLCLRIDLGDHGNRKQHPYGANGEHKHVITWENGKTIHGKAQALTEDDYKVFGGDKND